MAADWVGNLVTGAVGIAGVAGTYWTGRASRDAAVAQAREQREHALQDRLYAERREAYVGYLEAVQGARHALTQIRGLPTSPENGTEANELRQPHWLRSALDGHSYDSRGHREFVISQTNCTAISPTC